MKHLHIALTGFLLLLALSAFAQANPNPKIKEIKEPVAMFPRPDKKGLVGYADVAGSFRIKAVFEVAESLQLFDQANPSFVGARVRYNGKWGMIRNNGTFALDCVYDTLGLPNRIGLMLAARDGRYGLIAFNGTMAVPMEYDEFRLEEDVYWGCRKGVRRPARFGKRREPYRNGAAKTL